MNQRIRELEQQATETVKCGLNRTSTAEVFNRKKFAQLIIEECVEICLIHRVRNNDYNEGRTQCASDIKEHFYGVDECVKN